MQRMGRRRFLCCLGGFGALAGYSVSTLLSGGERSAARSGRAASRAVAQERPVRRVGWALGSTVSLTVFHRSESQAQRALAAAFAELERIEELMSLYRPSSQLSRLNHHRLLSDPHPMLLDVLACAQQTSAITQGAFDITIQPLWELYAAARQSGRLPGEAEVEAARRLVDWRRVEIDRGQVRLRGKGTKITLNGIAQGYAADRVTQTLRGHGIQNALIDTGEIGALGLKPPGDGWTIGIQHPRDEQAYVSLVKLAGRCLATSGDYATTFSPDYQHHHLFDPRTGHSPTELSSVSIVAATAMQADALSTAVFVMGPDAGASLLRTTPGADGMLIAKDGRTLVTAGFPVASTSMASGEDDVVT